MIRKKNFLQSDSIPSLLPFRNQKNMMYWELTEFNLLLLILKSNIKKDSDLNNGEL